MDELERMLGLESVKRSVNGLLRLIETNTEREENEQPLQEVALNRIFLGNPGPRQSVASTLERGALTQTSPPRARAHFRHGENNGRQDLRPYLA